MPLTVAIVGCGKIADGQFEEIAKLPELARVIAGCDREGLMAEQMATRYAIPAYYDDFAARYEAARRPNEPTGYHAMLDDLEVEFTMRCGRGKDLQEAGCGTGIVLTHLCEQARHADGFSVSASML